MESNFTSQFFAGNRARLRELFTGKAPIVVTSSGLLQRSGDSAYPFAQDANFWYLTGIDDPDILLVMDKGKEYLIVPNRSASREAFDGTIAYEALKAVSGISTIYNDTDGWKQLTARVNKVKHIATVAPVPAYIEHFGLFANPARSTLITRLKSYKNDLELLDLGPHLSRLRMIKQPVEIAAIQKAIDITVSGLKTAVSAPKLAKYRYEYELEAELNRSFRRHGSNGHAFEPIVAAGERACTLHNVKNSGPLDSNQLVIVDVGAEVEHYAADITRTVYKGTVSRRQQAVYHAVLEVQNYAISLLRPGTLLKDYEQLVEQFMGEKLRELGLIKTINHENVRKYYPHATSHFLGLNVHDVGDYDRPLEAGIVLTVEPGIYIKQEAIGVRIEDDVLITPTGNKLLSNKLSRELR